MLSLIALVLTNIRRPSKGSRLLGKTLSRVTGLQTELEKSAEVLSREIATRSAAHEKIRTKYIESAAVTTKTNNAARAQIEQAMRVRDRIRQFTA